MPLSDTRKTALALILTLAIGAALAAALWFGLWAHAGEPSASEGPVPALAALPGLPSDAPVLTAPGLAPADARAKNAAIPFAADPPVAALPFRFSGTPQDQSRAVECLALAAMAEAGQSDIGQRAVIQVVLNRVRHPAFAKTVCGVVFEGSQRRTGCQFSFTCDGSLARRYGEASWAAARQRAGEALGGSVFAPVGLATHYHTDWVFPYWSPKLEKLAKIETHLFFRWPGYWGSPRAMRNAYAGGEPDVSAAPTANATASAAPGPVAQLPSDTPAISGGKVAMRDPTGKANFVHLAPGTDAAAALALARTLCKPDTTCRVMGWADAEAIPAAFPLPPAARASLSFSFTRDPGGAEITLYDCRRFSGLPREQCIPRAR